MGRDYMSEPNEWGERAPRHHVDNLLLLAGAHGHHTPSTFPIDALTASLLFKHTPSHAYCVPMCAVTQARGVDAEAAAMLLRLYFGNPRLAVRINPRPNVVVVDRGEEDEVVQQQRGQEGKTEGSKLEEGMVEGGQGKGVQGQGQSAGQVGGEGKAAVKGEGEGQAGQA